MRSDTTSRAGRVRTSLDLPRDLQEQIKQAVHRGAAKSQNALILRAVEEYLDRLKKEWIDEQFAQMEHDERYQALNLQIAREFEVSDWEALQIVESDQ